MRMHACMVTFEPSRIHTGTNKLKLQVASHETTTHDRCNMKVPLHVATVIGIIICTVDNYTVVWLAVTCMAGIDCRQL